MSHASSRALPKLTEGSIPKHLIRLAIPSSLGMIFNTLYNLSDFWFAGRISVDALAGISIAGTVFFLLIAAGIGLQIGASAVIAPAVGANNATDAQRWAREIIGLSLVISALVMFIGWLATAPLVKLLGAEPHVAPYAITYINYVLLATPAFMLSFAAAGVLMAHGDTKSNRNALAVGFVINLLLNPLFIFVFHWGVAGLAIATGLVKVGSAFYLLKKIGDATAQAPPTPAFTLLDWPVILRQVLPASFNMLTVILGGFITVAIIGRFGSQHVAGYSIGLRLEQLLLLPALGMNSAVMALAGQNLGAGMHLRVKQTYYSALGIGLVMAAVSIPVMVFLSPQLMTFFTEDPSIIATGSTYLRIDAIAFYAYVVLFLTTASLQAMQQPIFPMVMGIARQLLVPMAVNVALVVYLGYPMITVFYTLITVVVIASLISHAYTRHKLNQLILQ